MTTAASLSFRLPDDLIQTYAAQTPPWGFPVGAGTSLGELTYIRTYSRKKPDGSKERWHETVRRVVEGCYSIQKDWCEANRLPWSEEKAVRSASEMYDRIFTLKFTPPGRGLWMMGTPFVHERVGSAALQNCAFVSTDGDIGRAVAFLMEASMLGVGVGFDTAGVGTPIRQPDVDAEVTYVVPDTREGWVEATELLVRSYLVDDPVTGGKRHRFDYSHIRPAGSPINGFGGMAAGPEPLIELHDQLRRTLSTAAVDDQKLTSRVIVDVMNLIGRCVVAGNVRRSAEIALGSADDDDFLTLKDFEDPRNAERNAWSWASNNSVIARVGGTDYMNIAARAAANGEPGIFWLDLARHYGRLVDPPNDRDYRAAGTNPCGEQTLESFECCNLVETFPTNHDDLVDYERTLKFAYLYAKSVTLLPTHWPETNAIMLRNRRIGASMSGVAQFAHTRGVDTLREWMDAGYEAIQDWDEIYSEWLCVRPSIKTTSIKPSGTVSLLAGTTPGVHYPVASTYLRRVRFAMADPLTAACRAAGFPVEPAEHDPTTAVVTFPVVGPDVPADHEVTVWEKTALAALAQRHWADNQVSVTLTFDQDREASQLENLLRMYEGQLKSASFLPVRTAAYAQLPYEEVGYELITAIRDGLGRLDVEALYAGDARDAAGSRYCDSEVCEL